MAFTLKLTDGTDYEFPRLVETGRANGAFAKTRKIEDDVDKLYSIIEYALAERPDDLDAFYDKLDEDGIGEFIKNFMGGVSPKG